MRFSVTPPPGRRGAQPPASLRGTMERGSTGQMRSSNHPPACGGDPQASAWGLTARKGAVWAEGLADGAPWARPGHHQAASCGLRRCRELGLREFVWVVASLPWRRGGCHRHAATQECTQIGGNGPSAPFWGTCVHCCAVVDRCGDARVYTDRRNWPLGAVLGHSCTRLRCGLGLWVALGSQQCTQMGGSGLSMPFWGICVHCCDSRGSCERPWGLARVYTDRRKRPLGAVLGHLCTLLRRELYDANYVGWYEHLNHHGVPVAPPCWSPLSWSGRQALREWRRR